MNNNLDGYEVVNGNFYLDSYKVMNDNLDGNVVINDLDSYKVMNNNSDGYKVMNNN